MNNIKSSVEVLVKLPWYTEGPVQDDSGNIFFTSLTGELIFKIDTRGKISEWARSRSPNGQAILKNRDHLVCDSKESSIKRFNKEGEFIGYDIHEICAGEKINSPNDIVIDNNGGIYFTDSTRYDGKIFYYDQTGTEKIVASGLDFPNGIALSSDGNKLFIAESYKNRILSIDLSNPIHKDPEVFCNLPQHPDNNIIKNLPDGIKYDHEGNLWVAHYGMGAIHKIAPEGDIIKTIKTEFPLTSNLFLTDHTIIVTGGYDEPGPGGLLQISRANII